MVTRARSKLNVKQVASLTKVGIYSDGGGLYLRVRDSGRSWFFIGTFNGKRFEMGLGSALDVALAKARERAEYARQCLLEGCDPRAERRIGQTPTKAEVTFGEFAMRHLDNIEDGFKNPKHRQQWRNTLTTYAAPLFELPLTGVKTEHVLEVLQPIWLSKHETASRVRGRIENVLNAAKVKDLRDGENPARWKGHLELLLPKRKVDVKHHAALPFTEIAALMADLRTQHGVAAKALEFTILTAARSGETRGMTWAEIDLENRLWTVPKARMKADKQHQVPLSEDALTALAAVQEKGLEPDDVVFPAPKGGTLSDMTLSAVLKRMGRGDVTVHGFRSTFRDWAGEKTGFARDVIEFALAHGIPDATERAYRRDTAVEKRRELMGAWADFCAGIVSKSDTEGDVTVPPPSG